MTSVGVIGKGAFGTAITHLLTKNEVIPECVDVGEVFTKKHDVLFLVVPAQQLRSALAEHKAAYDDHTLLVNCAKGIEIQSGKLLHEVVKECTNTTRYAVIAGPSFANEILKDIPTIVNIATSHEADKTLLSDLLTSAQFSVEPLDDIVELELSGAMKNIYALAAGFVAGSGGGENTLAHLQVLALREYTTLIHALEGNKDVIRPSVVGDLILTCKSTSSRNFQYGKALAETGQAPNITAEGAMSAKAIGSLADQHGVSLPLAESVTAIVAGETNAKRKLYKALGFDILD